MKFTIIASLLAASVAAIPKELQGRTGPCGDNCGRAIDAGRHGPIVQAERVAECNAYMRVTTTPEPK